jgi:hypothetical protein
MKKSDREAYYEFFLELPPTDYLVDIEIQDDHEKSTDDYAVRGLSDEQVSQIALDSLEDAGPAKTENKTSKQSPSNPQNS